MSKQDFQTTLKGHKLTKLYNDLPNAYTATHVGRLAPKDLYLGEKCCMDPKGNYCVRQQNGVWMRCNHKAAELLLTQHWLGGPHLLTADDIKRWLDKEVPVVQGYMNVPTSQAPAIEYEGRVFINSWDPNSVIKPDHTVLDDSEMRFHIELLLRMMRESLCARPDQQPLEEMLRLARSDKPEDLEWKFLISWLAAPLQSLGLNLQTNLWFLGELGGSGKGTLAAIMALIYGKQNSCLLNMEEVTHGGWSDQLVGKLIGCVNELEFTRKINWNVWIKQHCNEDTLTIRHRNTDAYSVLNFCNWMFFCNDECPMAMDTNDRRNMLISTTTDKRKTALAVQLRGFMDNREKARRMLQGFVHLLHQHPVDRRLLAFAPDTPIRLEIQTATAKDGEWLYWLENDEHYARDQWLTAAQLMQSYEVFVGQSRANRTDVRTIGRVLSKFARKGFIETNKKKGTHSASYLIPSDRFPANPEEEALKQAMAKKRSKSAVAALLT